MNLLRCFWNYLTYWEVKCNKCRGTGICADPPGYYPHSCCFCLSSKHVELSEVPDNFDEGRQHKYGKALVGTGVFYVRPWAPKTNLVGRGSVNTSARRHV